MNQAREQEAAQGPGPEEPEAGVPHVANAPFVNKLWRMVNDPRNNKYIRWMPGGKAIQIVDRDGFEKTLLPEHFKHKRFTSFVRQLNMYGWHKVQDLSAGTMNSSEDNWQFASPFFIQGHPELLPNIVRNRGHRGAAQKTTADEADAKEDSPGLKTILRELEAIKSKQLNIGEDLGRMRKDNELLWSEYYQTRERYDKHSQMLSRILRFLATVYGNQNKLLDMSMQDGNRFIEASQGAQQNMQLLPPNLVHAAQYAPMSAQPAAAPGQPPAGRVSPFSDSGISDLREIEQMHNQIQELGPVATPSSAASGTPSDSASPDESFHSRQPSFQGRPPPGRPLAPVRAEDRALTPSRALVPSRRVSQALVQQPLARSRSPAGFGGEQPRGGSVQPLPDEPAASKPFGADSSDPAKLFPDLGDFNADVVPPVTNQSDLDQISRDLYDNNDSLQNIQDWLVRLPYDEYGSPSGSSYTDSESHFNVNDFLAEDPQASVPAGLKADDPLSASLEDGAPSRKRARAA